MLPISCGGPGTRLRRKGFVGDASDMTMPRPTLRVVATYEPAELARELGYANEQRPGKAVRDYLRKKYPDHPKYQRWVLDEVQAADVRRNVPRKR
jgi:hypothetical protein